MQWAAITTVSSTASSWEGATSRRTYLGCQAQALHGCQRRRRAPSCLLLLSLLVLLLPTSTKMPTADGHLPASRSGSCASAYLFRSCCHTAADRCHSGSVLHPTSAASTLPRLACATALRCGTLSLHPSATTPWALSTSSQAGFSSCWPVFKTAPSVIEYSRSFAIVRFATLSHIP